MADGFEENCDDDLSFVAIGDSGSVLGSPVLHIPQELLAYQLNLVDPNLDREEIRQAHSALTTAYVALRDKYNRTEAENKELRKRSLKPGDTSEMARYSQASEGSVLDSQYSEYTVQNERLDLLRHPPEIASIKRRHRSKHGSWQVGDLPVDETNAYTQFLEKQIATTEEGKRELEDQLYELKIRISENDLNTSQFKQDLSRSDEIQNKLKSEVKGLRHRIECLEDENLTLKRQNQDVQKRLVEALSEKGKTEHQLNETEIELKRTQAACRNIAEPGLPETTFQDLNNELTTFKEVALYQKAVIERLLFKVKGKQLVPQSPSTPTNELFGSSVLGGHSISRSLSAQTAADRTIGMKEMWRSNSQNSEQDVLSPLGDLSPYRARCPSPALSATGNATDRHQTYPKEQHPAPSTNITWGQSFHTAQDNSSSNSEDSGSLYSRRLDVVEDKHGQAAINNEGLSEASYVRAAGRSYRPLNIDRNETSKATNQNRPQEINLNLNQDDDKPGAYGRVPVEVGMPLNNDPMACAKPFAFYNLTEAHRDDKVRQPVPVAGKTCPVCQNEFDLYEEEFVIHVDACIAAGERSDMWKCPVCHAQYPRTIWTTEDFQAHVAGHGTVFSAGSARVQQPNVATCPICSQTFDRLTSTGEEINAHVNSHYNPPDQASAIARESNLVKCPICTEKFDTRHTTEEAITAHVNSHFDGNRGQSLEAATLQFEVV